MYWKITPWLWMTLHLPLQQILHILICSGVGGLFQLQGPYMVLLLLCAVAIWNMIDPTSSPSYNSQSQLKAFSKEFGCQPVFSALLHSDRSAEKPVNMKCPKCTTATFQNPFYSIPRAPPLDPTIAAMHWAKWLLVLDLCCWLKILLLEEYPNLLKFDLFLGAFVHIWGYSLGGGRNTNPTRSDNWKAFENYSLGLSKVAIIMMFIIGSFFCTKPKVINEQD